MITLAIESFELRNTKTRDKKRNGGRKECENTIENNRKNR